MTHPWARHDRPPARAGGTEALARLTPSLQPLLRAVATAAGSEGRACLIDTGDGVERAGTALAIAKALGEARGAPRLLTRVLREILFEAERDLGDGTARLALLWGGVVRYGARAVLSGVPARPLAEALGRLGAQLSAEIERAGGATPDEAGLAGVARSAGATPEVAEALAAMLAHVGPDGAADILESREVGLRLETGRGYLLDAKPVSDAFSHADLDPAFILVADERVEDFGPLVPLLEGFATRGKALVVVARDVSGAALHALVRNHKENGLRAIALRPAAVSQAAADLLEDLAIATGGTLVSDRLGTSLAALRPGMLGRCARFTFAGGRAVFQDPGGEADRVGQRRAFILAEAERQKFLALDHARLQARAARLAGAWARLHLGLGAERERRALVEAAARALASARSALSGGVLPGGGIALVRGFDNLPPCKASDEAGRAALGALAAGLSALVAGLGVAPLPPVPASVQPPGLAAALGLDGVPPPWLLDPLLLTRSVLDRAVSGAVTLLRTGAVIHD